MLLRDHFMLLAAATKNVVDADDALWLAAGAVFVDESRLGQHPDVAAMLSQKAVLPCLTLALGEHERTLDCDVFDPSSCNIADHVRSEV